jgi:squalene cyclase
VAAATRAAPRAAAVAYACAPRPFANRAHAARARRPAPTRLRAGWGEDFTSCYDKDYARNGMERWGVGGSGVVNTAWALLALMAAKSSDVVAIRRGIEYLRSQQRDNGDWDQEGIAGVFNRACGISYTQYRNIFPIWALARYAHEYER